jgi:hypothetical protein
MRRGSFVGLAPCLVLTRGCKDFPAHQGCIEAVLSAAPEIDEASTHAPGPQAAHELHSLLGERGLRLHTRLDPRTRMIQPVVLIQGDQAWRCFVMRRAS